MARDRCHVLLLAHPVRRLATLVVPRRTREVHGTGRTTLGVVAFPELVGRPVQRIRTRAVPHATPSPKRARLVRGGPCTPRPRLGGAASPRQSAGRRPQSRGAGQSPFGGG